MLSAKSQPKPKKALSVNKEGNHEKDHHNDINNEGGEGYIPTRITKERYEMARAILNK